MKKSIFIWVLISLGLGINAEDVNISKSLEEVSKIDQTLEGPIKGCFRANELDELSKTSHNELKTKRDVSPFIKTCFEKIKLGMPQNFQGAISIAIDLNQYPMTNPIDNYISGLYGVKKWNQNVGLFSHPMCESYDEKLFAGTTTKKQNRANKVKDDVIKIAKAYNKNRAHYMAVYNSKTATAEDKSKALFQMKKFYYELMASLAYRESLSTADSDSSIKNGKNFATHYGVSNFKKNDGVKYYYDEYQSNEDSKRNIGLFQFSSDPKGNVAPCVKAWNDLMGKKDSSCKIENLDKKKTFDLLGASDQVFNAFCGVNKLVQSIGIQVNTDVFETKTRRRTHDQNYHNKKLKKSEQRCISIFSDSLNTYNHFGTLGFTTDDNTKHVLDDMISKLGL